MNTDLMHALMIVRLECSRALDAIQIDQPLPTGLGVALAMLDEEMSSESYRQRVQEAADRRDARAAAEQRRVESLERLRAAAQEHGFINAEGVVTRKLEEATGLRLIHDSTSALQIALRQVGLVEESLTCENDDTEPVT